MSDADRPSPGFHRLSPPWLWIGTALLLPLSLVLLAVWIDGENRVSEAIRRRSLESSQRQLQLIAAVSRLRDADAAARTIVISPSAAAIMRYRRARDDVPRLLAAPPFAEDMRLTVPLDRLRQLAARDLAAMDTAIGRARRGDRATALALLEQADDMRVRDDIRLIVRALMERERRQVIAEVDRYARRSAEIRRTMWAAILIGSLVLVVGMMLLWKNRRDRHRALYEAFEAAQRSRAILDCTIDAILILSPLGAIETINAAAATLLGYAPDELQWRDVSLLIDTPEGSGRFRDRVGLIGRRRSTIHVDRVARHRDGRLVPVDIAFGVITNTSEEHLVMSLRDISERKRVERVKDDLISTVSHELRTPLTSVIGALGLLRAGAAGRMGDNAARLVEIAENNSRRLIRLINDMLDINSIDSGKLQFVRSPIDLRDVVTRACEGSEGLAAAGDVAIDCRTPDDPVMVMGDADRLLQVITNLVSNAIHVSRPGQSVDIVLQADPPSRAVVRIEDRGPGIPLAFRERIFGRFERADRSVGAGGTGLGLAISREIVTRHHGRIWFEDRPGGGTSFLFDIDLIREANVDHEWEPSILVAASDPALAGEAEEIAATLGYACDVVRSADAVREALTQRHYAALIVDIDLPPDGGLDFCRSLDADVPALLFTAAAAPDGVVTRGDAALGGDRLGEALSAILARADMPHPVILHVDDDHDILEVTASALRPDARIIKATSLAAARSIMQTMTPDIVILDLHLRDGNGLDLLPLLIGRGGAAIPAIIYSGHDVPADRAGDAAAVLVKARGSIPDLRATVSRVLAAARDAVDA